jgi:hypothetical protein
MSSRSLPASDCKHAVQLILGFGVVAEQMTVDLILEIRRIVHIGGPLGLRLCRFGHLNLLFGLAEVQIGRYGENHRDHDEKNQCDLQTLAFARCHDQYSLEFYHSRVVQYSYVNDPICRLPDKPAPRGLSDRDPTAS